MNRITEKDLRAVVERINRVTGSPMESWVKKDSTDQNRAQIGNYHLSFAYGGAGLNRMVNAEGGVTCPIGNGHVPKRELYERMHAYLRGLEERRTT